MTIFLNGVLSEVIYIQQPIKFNTFRLIYLLRKALYELKQTSKLWYNTIAPFLNGLNFYAFDSNQCFFINANKRIYITLYVNNIMFIKADLNYIKMIKKAFVN